LLRLWIVLDEPPDPDVVVSDTTFPFASVTVVVTLPSLLVTEVVVSEEDDDEDEDDDEVEPDDPVCPVPDAAEVEVDAPAPLVD